MFEDAVGLGAHEHFSFVYVLSIDIFVDWQVGSVFFKETLFPNMEWDNNKNETTNEKSNEIFNSVILLIIRVREQMWQSKTMTLFCQLSSYFFLHNYYL